jgi:hypothetical protein
MALPLLLRSLGEGPSEWNDATSVYGYGGPVASHEKTPEPVVRNFHAALKAALVEQGVVAVFSRLHPLIAQGDLLAGLGECRASGQTVSIDLTLPPEKQWAQYRDAYKRRVNKQRREGTVTCLHDQEKRYLGEFIDIYEETMRRVKAQSAYFSMSTISLKSPASCSRYCSCLSPWWVAKRPRLACSRFATVSCSTT